MRLLVGSSSPPDKGQGIRTYVNLLCEELIELGHEIYYLSPTPSDRTWLKQNNIIHLSTDQDDKPTTLAKKLIKFSDKHRIEGFINNDNPILQSIAPVVSSPFLAVGHMGRTSVAALACFNKEWVDYVVAISEDMRAIFIQKYRVSVFKTPVIYNGVKKEKSKRQYKNTGAELRVLFAGGYSRNKGADLIYRSIQNTKGMLNGIRLDWYGDVPNKIQNRMSSYPEVNFHGKVDRSEFLERLRETDVLLFPSRIEGCPMVMLEAMSFGVIPIVSNGKGAMRWLITSGKEGFICNLDDWQSQMAECLQFLVKNRPIVNTMADSSYKRFIKNYQMKNTATQLVSLLNRPTVNRNDTSKEIHILRWHRPLRKDRLKAPLIDRVAIRLGWLRTAGKLNVRNIIR